MGTDVSYWDKTYAAALQSLEGSVAAARSARTLSERETLLAAASQTIRRLSGVRRSYNLELKLCRDTEARARFSADKAAKDKQFEALQGELDEVNSAPLGFTAPPADQFAGLTRSSSSRRGSLGAGGGSWRRASMPAETELTTAASFTTLSHGASAPSATVADDRSVLFAGNYADMEATGPDAKLDKADLIQDKVNEVVLHNAYATRSHVFCFFPLACSTNCTQTSLATACGNARPARYL
jgi:hypothetical protein